MFPFHSSFLIVLVICIAICQADDSNNPPPGPMGMHIFHGDTKPDFQKCLDEAGLTKDELKAAHENPPKEPTQKQLCLAKCLATSSGLLKDGVVATDIMKKNTPPFIDEATLNTAITCIEAAGKISTCDDMSKIIKCIPKPPARPQ